MSFIEQVAETEPWSGAPAPFDAVLEPICRIEHAGPATDVHNVPAHNRRLELLNRVVEAEILPRLTLARTAPASAVADTNNQTTEDDTRHLVRLLLGYDDTAAAAFIEALGTRGIQPSVLYLGIITNAARILGELWLDDRCSFAEVTIASGRLQQIVRALSPAFQKTAVTPASHPDTILLLPAPNDQHTFGLVILGEFFQREGWHVLGGPVSTGTNAADIVRDTWVDVAGFSAGSNSRVEALAAAIRAVRQVSRNRNIRVMVGGPLFLEHPELVARVGADTTALDAPAAVRQARALLAMRAAAD